MFSSVSLMWRLLAFAGVTPSARSKWVWKTNVDDDPATRQEAAFNFRSEHSG